MPELPEVEHIGRWLRPQLLGRLIVDVVLPPGGERCLPQGRRHVLKALRQHTIESVGRRSKVLLLGVGSATVAIHLKMTGQLWLDATCTRKYTRVSLRLADGMFLNLADARKFGWIQVWTEGAHAAWERDQGPEPLPDLPAGWEQTLRGNRAIKAVLLDQAVVAGIGNIYADEILFRAKLAPSRQVGSLTAPERRRLREAIQREMQAAVDEREGVPDQKRVGGGDRSVKALFDWKVFQRESEPCRRCGQPILRITLAGRGTYFCAQCQR